MYDLLSPCARLFKRMADAGHTALNGWCVDPGCPIPHRRANWDRPVCARPSVLVLRFLHSPRCLLALGHRERRNWGLVCLETRIQSCQTFCYRFEPGVGQNVVFFASPAAGKSAFLSFAFPVNSTCFSPDSLPTKVSRVLKVYWCWDVVVWWLVCTVNRRQIEVCFSPDVIRCGWLGSKYQLTN